MRLLSKLAVLAMFGTPALFALTCTGDTSGNSTLKASYRFRNVIPLNFDNNGNVTETVAASGVIVFNGAGGYSVTSGSYVDNMTSKGAVQTLPAVSGCYAIGANGTGYMVNPVIQALYNTVVYDYGAASQGVFSGSMTETANAGVGIVDIFVAISPIIANPVTPTLNNAIFNSSYWTGVIDYTSGINSNIKNALFNLVPNGAGGLGALTINGQSALQNSGGPVTQNSTGGTYTVASDGTIALSVAAPTGVSTVNSLFTGSKTMYMSSDGNFILGWSSTGYDIIFGVRTLTNPADQTTLTGTYYTSALELGIQAFCAGASTVDAYSGSMNADGTGNEVVAERLWSPLCLDGAYDYTADDYTQFNTDGTLAFTDFAGNLFAAGDGGNAFVGVSGSSQFYSLVVGLKAPSTTGSGVFLSPTGVVNAASFAPITAPLVPGELITLFGTGLAPATLVSVGGSAFPTSLGGVQVTINQVLAPIYYVSKTQISVIVPYGLASSSSGLALVQVNNNGQLSNTVTLYSGPALAGLFTQNQNGIGYAIALHPDGSFVSQSNPAKGGETLSFYMTGLGTVTPTVTDGSLGPANPLSYADSYTAGYPVGSFIVYFNDYNNEVFDSATVSYAGLAPGLAGLYQMNVQVPTDVGPGDVYVEVAIGDPNDPYLVYSDVNQVQLPVGSAKSAAVPVARGGAKPSKGRAPGSLHLRPLGSAKPKLVPSQQ